MPDFEKPKMREMYQMTLPELLAMQRTLLKKKPAKGAPQAKHKNTLRALEAWIARRKREAREEPPLVKAKRARR